MSIACGWRAMTGKRFSRSWTRPLVGAKAAPDVVVTVDALLKRAEELARMLHGMSATSMTARWLRIEVRIEAVKRHEEGTERERQLNLLERQHQALSDLLTRASASKSKSSRASWRCRTFGLIAAAAVGRRGGGAERFDERHAAARALSRDVDHVIAAAGEIRDVLSASPAPAVQSPPPGGGVRAPVLPVESWLAQHSVGAPDRCLAAGQNSNNSTKLAAASSQRPAVGRDPRSSR